MKSLIHNIWIYSSVFLIGVLVSYFFTEFEYFEIDYSLKVSEVIISAITLFIGLYIAITIQKNINKNQNQYNFLENKLNKIWMDFSAFQELIAYSEYIDNSTVIKYRREVLLSLGFLKTIFSTYEMNIHFISEIENEIDSIEQFLGSLRIEQNIIYFDSSKRDIEKKLTKINLIFSNILVQIQEF